MSRIICHHCGFANPIKSEFMTFCESCGKKLPDNFQDWRKFNPGKSFNDYKTVMDAQNPEMIGTPIKETKKINIGLIIGLVIAALLLGEGYYLGFTGLQRFKTITEQRALQNYLEESVSWRLKEDKQGNFKIRFPGNPIKDIQTEELGGETIYYVTYALETHPDVAGNSYFAITYTQYPQKAMDEFNRNQDLFFNEFFRSHANAMRGLIKDVLVNNFQDNPGRIAIVSLENGEMELINWSFFVDNTQYLLQTACPIQHARNEMIDKFFDSFELLE
jgi:hypothetical protein